MTGRQGCVGSRTGRLSVAGEESGRAATTAARAAAGTAAAARLVTGRRHAVVVALETQSGRTGRHGAGRRSRRRWRRRSALLAVGRVMIRRSGVVLHARSSRLAGHAQRVGHGGHAVDHLSDGRDGIETGSSQWRHVDRIEAPRKTLGRSGQRTGHLSGPAIVAGRSVAGGVKGGLICGRCGRSERLHQSVELRSEGLEVGGGGSGRVHRIPLALPPFGASIFEPDL